jgi:hypothetical protein
VVAGGVVPVEEEGGVEPEVGGASAGHLPRAATGQVPQARVGAVYAGDAPVQSNPAIGFMFSVPEEAPHERQHAAARASVLQLV